MNPRVVVVTLLTMITAVTGFAVMDGIDEFSSDASTTRVVSEQGR